MVLKTKKESNPEEAAEFILQKLSEDRRWDLDRNLNPEARAEAIAFGALARETFQEASFYYTWMNKESFESYTRVAEGDKLPFPLHQMLPRWRRKRLLSRMEEEPRLEGHERQILARVEAAYDALQVKIGSNRYLLGDAPCSVDALMFSQLLYHQRAPVCEQLHVALSQRPVLSAYVDRIAEQCYGSQAIAALPYAPARKVSDSSAFRREKETEKQRIFNRNRNIWLACVGSAMVAYFFFGEILDVSFDPEVDVDEDEDDE